MSVVSLIRVIWIIHPSLLLGTLCPAACFSLPLPAWLYPLLACQLCQHGLASWWWRSLDACALRKLTAYLAFAASEGNHWATRLRCCIFCSKCRAATYILHSPIEKAIDFLAITHTCRYQLLCVIVVVVHGDTSVVYQQSTMMLVLEQSHYVLEKAWSKGL